MWRIKGIGPNYIKLGVGNKQGGVRYLMEDVIKWQESRKVEQHVEKQIVEGEADVPLSASVKVFGPAQKPPRK